jgi:transforming growth factor-beta-induced protein
VWWPKRRGRGRVPGVSTDLPITDLTARAGDPLSGSVPYPYLEADLCRPKTRDREGFTHPFGMMERIFLGDVLARINRKELSMRRILKALALMTLLALVAAACGNGEAEDTTTVPEATVLDLAIEAGQFTTLVAAIEAAGLVETLEGEGPFTVFAPTDAAFDAAFDALGITAEELLADTVTLAEILTYHVLPQAANSQLVATLDGSTVPTVNGAEVSISVEGGQIMVNQATVVSADLEAQNGIVHVINAVLLPPDVAEALGVDMDESMEETTTTTTAESTTTTTVAAGDSIADIVAGDENFSILLAAVEAAGLTEALADPNATLTVFAPTNEAFEKALEALGITAEELLGDPETLTAILTYHVLGEVVTSSDLAAAGLESIPVETLNGAELVVQVGADGSVTFADQGETMVIQADVEASNGVIHVIDGVLLPPQS